MFEIRFPSAHAAKIAVGSIVIGTFEESVDFNLGHWSAEDYRRSWARSAAAIIERGFGRFIVSVPSDRLDVGILWTWPCWRLGEAVAIQNHLVFLPTTPAIETIEAAETFRTHFSALTDDGEQKSTWYSPLGDIVDFERSLERQPRQ